MNQSREKRKPGRPKATESSQTMIQILRTASALFMEYGFEKVSLETVAKTCGLTKASVYYYFSNKSMLFTKCLLFVLKVAHDQTVAIMNGPGTLQERLREVAIRYMQNTYVDFETMMREASSELSEEQTAEIRNAERKLHEVLEHAFQKAMEKEEIVPYDPFLLSHLFVAMLTVRNRQEVMNKRQMVEEVASEMVRLLFNGLSPR
ncbi:hypothetical protein AT864_02869 [Anoxybacillus sp. P3H1B]|uniref:TetR/AcrR family transcriptional regulator n=1 Tax=Anoxybacillus sp. P3H1B TaxID=1769293 RepID=UPI0007936B8D|nr:TetR/AcrR family transcriptional regulator [Anoxybacillus sp. P3H1B]KXG08961.1 hypothetical protein AT864_02869 [Anoxybacillus sp. P3H1B]